MPVFFPAHAHADEVGEPIHVVYGAPAECPPRADFVAQILLWAPGAREEDVNMAASRTRKFEVTLRRLGPGGQGPAEPYEGQLVVRTPDGRGATRSISSESCPRAARALALMVALSLGSPEQKAAVPERADPSDPSRDPAVRAAAEHPPPSAAPAAPLEADPSRRSSSRRESARVAIDVGASAALLMLADSRAVSSLGVHVELRAQDPSVRLAVHHSEDTLASGDVAGTFAWTWARLDGCPLRFGRSFEVRPCAVFDLGEVSGAGSGGTTSTRRGRPWIGVGALGRVAKRWGPLSTSVDVGALVLLHREVFAFDPAPVVYSIPAWVPFAGLAIAIGGSP